MGLCKFQQDGGTKLKEAFLGPFGESIEEDFGEIGSDSSVVVTVQNMSPQDVTTFSAMLLASFLIFSFLSRQKSQKRF